MSLQRSKIMPMSGYTKLFNSILASTIWREDNCTRIVWITMLAMADRDGIVEGSIPGLADMARVSIPDVESALKKLMASDPYSRCKDYDGRRIAAIEGGWMILNHAKYRQKLSADERREYYRIKKAEYRSKVKDVSTNVQNVQDKSTMSSEVTHPEAEAEAEASPDPTPEPPPLCCTVCDGGIKTKKFTKPSIEELTLHAAKIGLPESEVKRFLNYYESNGWRVGKNPMKSWPHAMQTWKLNYESGRYQSSLGPNRTQPDGAADRNRHLAGTNDEYIKAGLKL